MTPTMNLRFVEREITVPLRETGGIFSEYKTIRVLQQWWERRTPYGLFLGGKWQDVPLETEE